MNKTDGKSSKTESDAKSIEEPKIREGINCKVSVKRMDYLGREYSGDSLNEHMEASISYIKLINVPSMFDIGCTEADPRTDFLTMTMLDTTTHKTIKSQFSSKSSQRHVNEVDAMREQLKALHTTMQVSKVEIKFDQDIQLQTTGSKSDRGECTLTIDGTKIQQKHKIQQICISRLMKSDMT